MKCKLLSTSLAILLLSVTALAGVPQSVSYQGYMAMPNGNPVQDGDYTITFSIYPTADGPAAAIWSSGPQVVPLNGGSFEYYLGSNVQLPPDLFAIDTTRWLGIQVDPDDEMVPRTHLVSVPYAYKALDSDTAGFAYTLDLGTVTTSHMVDGAVTSAKILDGTLTFSDIGQNGATTGQVMKWNGSAWTAADDESGGGGYWTLADGALYTSGEYGIARAGNTLFGVNDSTHVNLGVACTTGANGFSHGYATVGGGYGNTASRYFSTVGGGRFNKADSNDATVSGGRWNFAGTYGSVGGGYGDTASGWGASVGGGQGNIASGWMTAVGGGSYNTASGWYGSVGGGTHSMASDTSATVAGGSHNNATGVAASVVGGSYNIASGYYAAVGGGRLNTASDTSATVGGGAENLVSGRYATVSGGYADTASGSYSSVGGGVYNRADSSYSTVGGGRSNSVSGKYSTISGGYADTITATGDYSYLFGIGSKLTQDSTFMVDMPHVRFGDDSTGYEFPSSDGSAAQVMATDGAGQLSWTAPGGGGNWTLWNNTLWMDGVYGIAKAGNTLHGFEEEPSTHVNLGVASVTGGDWGEGNFAVYATVGGGFTNTAIGYRSTIGGGSNNWAGMDGTVGGGSYNRALGRFSVIAGGGSLFGADSNSASGAYSAILGGRRNTASGYAASVGGGFGNTASDTAATVGGGSYNNARGEYSVVSGGGGATEADSNSASGAYSAVGGGTSNATNGLWSTVGGGKYNRAWGNFAVVAGGGGNNLLDSNSAGGNQSFIGGGQRNKANGRWAVVVGGATNLATGQYDFIAGGTQNVATGGITSILGGKYNSTTGFCSVAGGTAAKANHDGSIVLAANHIASGGTDSIRSGGDEQMVLRADGGIYITNAGGLATYDPTRLINTSTGAYLSTGGTWTDFCDRDGKENFIEIDNQVILQKVAELPITRWNYKTEGQDVQHIGPVAQDFHEAFGLGHDDKSISGLDRSGVALAAIKALHERVKALEGENSQLKTELGQTNQKLDKLQQLVESELARRNTGNGDLAVNQ